tara:strand:+ start:6629 stop:9769 length:3141 start_codon:yes stop_codon:yes gene_type:complete
MKNNYTNRLWESFKHLIKGALALTLVGFTLSAATAQERVVTGSVVDENGEGLPGVNIIIKGTASGVITDFNGQYRLNLSEAGTALVFSAIGYNSQEVTVGARSIIDVTMSVNVAELEEVIVTGYAVQQKKDVTGSVAVVRKEELVALPQGNVANQLQGRVAGVTVTGSGKPGATSKVRIRGFSSFGGNDPLYIIDGIPGNIETIAPEDVETISVLKDAGAASIYGSRASNGVVLITTKKGGQGVKIDFNTYTGIQYPGKSPSNLLNAKEYADLQWLVYANDGTVEDHPIYGPSSQASPKLPNWGADTDWYDETTENAAITNYNLSMSGGSNGANFFASLNYFDQNGTVKYQDFERVSARFNSSFKAFNNKLTIGQNLNVSNIKQPSGFTNLSEGNAISGVYRNQPLIPVVMTTSTTGISHDFVPGEYGGTGLASRLGNNGNTIAELTRARNNAYSKMELIGNVFAELEVIDGLKLRTSYGGRTSSDYFSAYNMATYENAENVATASMSEGASYYKEWIWTNTLAYSKTFGQNSINATLGYEALEYGISRGVSGQRGGYFSDALSFRTLDNGATIINANSYFATPTTLASSFLRVDYSLKDKYLLGATVRRDGSSRFGADTRYGTFPSLTAGWRLSEEAFLAGSSVFTDVKIRGGWGQMGSQLNADPANQFNLYGGSANQSYYDLNGTGTSSLQGFRPTRIGNADAQWETNTSTNIGFDAGLFNNKVEVVFDWYSKQTEGLLFAPENPGTAGNAQAPSINVGSMSNKGIDLQLIYRDDYANGLSFEGNFTLTSYTNEIVAIADGYDYFDYGGSRIGNFSRNEVGHPLSAFYGYEVAGLFQSDGEATASGQDGAEAGFFQYTDNDGVAGITDADRTYIGNPNPDFTYGLNLQLGYKQFELTAYFYGYQGGDIFNYTKWWTDFWPSFQGQKSTDLLNNSWTPTNTGATTPKATQSSNFSTNAVANSYYIEDGSFARLRNLQLAYNLPSSALSALKMSNARVYIQGVNIFTATKYTGLDPELGGDDRAFGIDYGNFPLNKQVILGLNVSF